jgi:uncharacterized oligopeptide transporter (OPT) family protein
MKDAQPLVSASVRLPEITVKAVVLAAAIIYLGLFASMTLSASIPAAGVIFTIPTLLLSGLTLMNLMGFALYRVVVGRDRDILPTADDVPSQDHL